jgi:hypothetical protein
MRLNSPSVWARETFGHAQLGDPRRTQRLLSLATSVATTPGHTLSSSTHSPAEMEGAYRFIRNEQVDANAIADAGFEATAAQAQKHDILLALEDSTSLKYKHASIGDTLGYMNDKRPTAGLMVHSVLLFNPVEQSVVGLIEQNRWTRDRAQQGKSKHCKQRDYTSKESYKWEQGSCSMRARLGETMRKTISVCDREADIFEYLTHKTQHGERFVVRSSQNRCIEEHDNRLYEFASNQQCAGTQQVKIAQRGGRKARTATVEVRYCQMTVKAPKVKTGENIPMYYVGCTEAGEEEHKLSWHLMTSEPVHSREDALRIVSYYEMRWLIEDYHKAWKTGGTEVESLRMQSKDNLERMAVILAFLATRILALRFIKVSPHKAAQSCESIVPTIAWKLLWKKWEKRTLPATPPDNDWLYRNLAKLGGWKDTQRNGRAGCKTLWKGWFKLQTLLEGYDLTMSLNEDL